MRYAYQSMGWAGLLMAGLWACGSSSTSTPTETPKMTYDEFKTAWTEAICTVGTCCQRDGIGFTGAICEATAKLEGQTTWDAFSTNPNLSFNPEAAAACVAALKSALSNCTQDDAAIQKAGTACQGVFVGKKAVGQSCATAYECAPVTGHTVTCEALAVNDAGPPPAPVDAAPLADAGPIEGGVVPPPVEAGPAPRACVAAMEKPFVSRAHGKLGDACGMTYSEGGGQKYEGRIESLAVPTGAVTCYASEGLFCNPNTLKCENLPKAGERCAFDSAATWRCADDWYCSDARDGSRAACLNAAKTGEECDPTAGQDQCGASGYCDTVAKLCAGPRKSKGSPCQRDGECESGYRCSTVCVKAGQLANVSLCRGDISSLGD